MAETTGIQWANATINLWRGCKYASPGCAFCYAARRALRVGENFATRIPASTTLLAQPLLWNAKAEAESVRRRVFVNSLSDFFEKRAELGSLREAAWDMIRKCQHLDWLLLTKRPEQIVRMLPPDWGYGYPNVWLGISIENQREGDRRITAFADVPAQIKWVSAEPLLESIDVERHLSPPGEGGLCWIICGGETGSQRWTKPAWMRDLRDQCHRRGARFFLKQMTGKALIPPDLFIREYPDQPPTKVPNSTSTVRLDGGRGCP